jgi:hypothetical protein
VTENDFRHLCRRIRALAPAQRKPEETLATACARLLVYDTAELLDGPEPELETSGARALPSAAGQPLLSSLRDPAPRPHRLEQTQAARRRRVAAYAKFGSLRPAVSRCALDYLVAQP